MEQNYFAPNIYKNSLTISLLFCKIIYVNGTYNLPRITTFNIVKKYPIACHSGVRIL